MSQDYQVYWGDLHRQTNWTCGEGTADDHFRVTHKHFGMDFAAVTDNARLAEDPTERLFPGEKLLRHRHFLPGLAAHSISQSQWETLQTSVKRYHQAGEFIPFLAYEWCSARFGDHNVYFSSDEGLLHLPERVDALHQGDPNDRQPRLIIPHHPGYSRGRRGLNWNYHDPYHERLVEIHSTQHGCSEDDTCATHPLYSRSMGGAGVGTSVQHALQRGHKLGFTAGSDSHALLQKPGLTGVFTDGLTKNSLFTGLWERRTIASTGPKFVAWFSINGYGLGSMLCLDSLPTVTITLQHNDWEKVELIRNGRVIRIWDYQDSKQLTYQEVSEGLAPDNYYYVRITLPGNELVWLSPIWVSFLPDTPFARDTLYWLPEIDIHFWAIRECHDRVVLKMHNLGRAEGPVRNIQLDVVDAEGHVLVGHAVSEQESLAPGTTGEWIVPLASSRVSEEEPLAYRVHYRDHWDNYRVMERTRILASGEATVFPF